MSKTYKDYKKMLLSRKHDPAFPRAASPRRCNDCGGTVLALICRACREKGLLGSTRPIRRRALAVREAL